MIEKWTDLSDFLEHNHVHCSTPTRLDCGGSTDHRLTGLLCKSWQPATTNIAIDLRAFVRLRPYASGKICVVINGLGRQEFAAPDLPFVGPFALVSALVCYFGVHGLRIDIKTEFPFQSGLGGSGSVAIALMGAIYTALQRESPIDLDLSSIVKIAHHLEDSLFGNSGMQDQAAALYGGVNLWEWHYSDHLDFRRFQIPSNLSSLNEHILLAYTGRPHQNSQHGSLMLDKFKKTTSLGLFASISEQARRFAGFLGREDFRSAGECLTAEYELRSTLLPIMLRDDLELIEMGRKAHCGVSVTGRGGGGCIWAIGERQDISKLKRQWTSTFERRKLGFLLPVEVTCRGLKIGIKRVNGARVPSEPVEMTR